MTTNNFLLHACIVCVLERIWSVVLWFYVLLCFLKGKNFTCALLSMRAVARTVFERRWLLYRRQRCRRGFATRDSDKSKTTVVVALSGGVDSSVSAYLLKEAGYNVVGLYMKNWDSADEEGVEVCPSEQDFKDVEKVGKHLDIPIYQVSFVKQYWQDVFEPFLDGYKRGLTPNPDILCNKEIKFKRLAEHARDLGGDCLATGHYVQTRKCTETGQNLLISGRDPLKDQSYFLCGVPSGALENVMFPVGHLRKSKVREIAQVAGLPTAEKRDSYGICFVGKRNFKDFIDGYLPRQPGNFVSIEDGAVLGEHDSLSFYTIGQGARLSGASEKWFVVDKIAESNTVLVAQGAHHPALFCDSVSLPGHKFNWVGGAAPDMEKMMMGETKMACRVRYRQELEMCHVAIDQDTDTIEARFERPGRAAALGQTLALYSLDGQVCFGGGAIERTGPSYWEMGKEVVA